MTRPAREDAGFTLIELLLVSAIVGIVVPAIAGVMLIFFRTAFVASTRTDRAHDAGLLASYLQPDLASTRSDPVLNGAGCSSAATISWARQDYVPNGNGTAHAYVAAYAVSAATGSDGPYALRRTYSVDGVAQSTVLIAHNLGTACGAVFSLSNHVLTADVTQSDSSGNAETSVLHFAAAAVGRS